MAKYIFYLHPSPGTKLCDAVSKYWDMCTEICKGYTNYALMYPFHVSLTGFFTLDEKNLEEELDHVIEIGREVFKNLQDKPVTDFHSYSFRGMSGITIKVPSISDKLFILENIPGVKSKTGLHLTLYHEVEDSIRKIIENTTNIKIVRETEWENIDVILWKFDDKGKWIQVYDFGRQIRY